MALAVAGAVTAPGLALAQVPTTLTPQPGVASNAGITLYGRVDATIMYDKFSESGNKAQAESKKGDLLSPGNAMGVRGREDLGGGTAAWFQLEIGVWPTERLDTATTTGNNWGGRNSAVGISSGVGDIVLGNWDTPYKQTYFIWNSLSTGPFSAGGVTMGMADTTGALNSAACATAVSNATGAITTTPVCTTEVTSSATAWSRRINNSVQYWSPVFSGFQVKLMTTMANYQMPSTAAQAANGLPKPKEYSANATWARGPLTLGVGYDYHEGLRPLTTAGGNVNPKDSAYQLAGKFNFGPGEIGVGYESIKYDNNGGSGAAANGMTVPAYVVNGRFNIGPGAIWASYSATDAKSCSQTNTTVGTAACGLKAKEYSVGYDYVLSKRTKLYVAFNKIDNAYDTAKNIGTTYYYIAGPATNNGGGNSGGLAAGTDVQTFGLGIQHVF
jgi:predicted porin